MLHVAYPRLLNLTVIPSGLAKEEVRHMCTRPRDQLLSPVKRAGHTATRGQHT